MTINVQLTSLDFQYQNYAYSLSSLLVIIEIAMADMKSTHELFETIAEAARTSRAAYSGTIVYGNFVGQELAKVQKDFPKVTPKDYFLHQIVQNNKKQQALVQNTLKPTASQLWDAAYSYNLLGNDGETGSAGTVTKLQTLLNYPEWEAVPLGKLWGHAQLALIPGKGALPATEEDNVTKGRYRYAATDSGAIYYADGHPSEFDPSFTETQSYSRRRLRRFVSLGWVIHIRSDGSWYKTGHALVIDMENGRGHQPWFVLASHWPVNDETPDGSFVVHADRRVARNDSTQHGVLPGGRNRTPVAMVESSDKKSPVLKQFGPNFEFSVARFGGDRAYDRVVNYGPDLAYVMEWYWDPLRKQEVCFDKDGEEYMRYDRGTKEIFYPNLKKMWMTVAGEVGMFGTLIVRPGEDFVTLEERMNSLAIYERQNFRHERSAIETF